MHSWKYRAYDVDGAIHEGTDKASDFQSLALQLRQKGLQILEATKLNPNDALALSRLDKMKNRINPEQPQEANIANANDGRIHRLLKWLIRLFRR